MKKNILTLLILLSSIVSAQGFENTFSWRIGANVLSFDNMDITPVVEAELNINMSEYFSLDYRIGAGYKYFHSPLTAPVSMLIGLGAIASSDSSSKALYTIGAIISIIIPEGVSAHIPLGKQRYLSPSIAPLAFEYLGRTPTSSKQKLYAAGNFGLKYDHFINNNWFFTLQGMYKVAYSREFRQGTFFGLQVGKSFN